LILTSCVLDVAHWDADDHHDLGADLAKAMADPVAPAAAVIAKATQGKDAIDHSWLRWVETCKRASVEFGSYHFASNTEPGDQQADWYLTRLAAAGLDMAKTARALDFERNPNPLRTMSLQQAEAFVQHVFDKTGVWPLLYGDVSFHHQITDPRSPLVKCPLWVAMYGGSGPPVPPAFKAAGKSWKLWQHTDGKYGANGLPKSTPCFPRMDRSAYKGTVDELKAEWPRLGG
jgi:lysozyme